MNIAYVINSRMPTEKAQGVQTVRMCEGLEKSGANVVLFHSRRKQPDKKLEDRTVENHYDLKQSLEVRSLSYFDAYRLVDSLGPGVSKFLILIANLTFPFVAFLAVYRSDADYAILRDWQVAALFVLLGFPTVFSAHSVDSLGFTARARWVFNHIGDRDSLVLVVANSEATADGMADIGVPREKILARPNGVDISDYEPEISKEEARDRTGLPGDERLLVYTGSLVKQKGADVLARASQYVNGKVVLVGGVPEQINRLERLVTREDLKDVIVVGRVKPREVPPYQFAADVLVLPPLAGNFKSRHQPDYTSPLKLFEYMAARRPIVASDLPPLHEVLEDGTNAIFVPPGEPEAIADAVARLRDDEQLCQELVENAANDVRQYTWESRARRVTEEVERRSS